jgi:AsmA protein
MKKFLVGAVSLIIIVVIALTVFIKIYVTPEKVKEYIIPVAEESLNRKVSIGRIDINILEGIALNDFTIKEADQKTDFVKCKDFILKFQLLPLLSRNVVIDELKIVAPSVRIERDKKGRYNFNDIGKKDVPEENVADNSDEDGEELPISLLVNKISISDAKLSLTDLKKELPDFKSTADVDISIKSLSGSELLTVGVISIDVDEAVFREPSNKRISNISSELDYELSVDLQSGVVNIEKADIKLQQISASIKGVLKQFKTSPEIDLSVHMPKVKSADIRDLAGLFTDLKGINLSGSVAGDAKLKGKIEKLDSLSVAGSFVLNDVGINHKDIDTNLDGELKFALESDNLHIDRAELKIDGIAVSIKGDVKKIKTSQNLDIAFLLPETKAGKVRTLIAPFVEMEDMTLSGTVSADSKIKGSMKKLDALYVDSSLVLNKVGVKYKDISSTLDADLKVILNSGNLNVQKAKLNVDGIPVSLKGDIRKVLTSPDLDIALYIPKAKTEKLQAVLAPFVRVEGLHLSGHLAADLKVKGRIKKPETMSAGGDVSLDKLRIEYDKVDAVLDGKVKLDKKTMHVDVRGTSGRNSARLKGSVSNIFKNQNINLNVYSKKLYLDEIVLPAKKESTQKPGAKKPAESKPSSAKEAEPMKLKLMAKGEVKVDSAVYKGMSMSSFHMKYTFKDNKLNVSKMSADAGKGKFALNSLVDFSKTGYTYNLTTNIDSMHAEELVNAFFPKAKDKVFGIITSNLKLRGKGTLPKNVKKNLIGNADFNIRDGKITDAEIARKLSIFIDLGELETIEFSKAEGTVNISNSIAKLNSIFVSDELQLDPRGNIGLDETIDLAFDLKMSPDLTDKVKASVIRKNIRDDGGWGTIPLFVNGTFSDPEYGVDVAKVGQKVINKEINKFLDKYLNKGKSTEPQPLKEDSQPKQEDSQPQEPGNKLEDILKQLPGLF